MLNHADDCGDGDSVGGDTVITDITEPLLVEEEILLFQ